MTNVTVTLNELINEYGLATTQKEIETVLECAKPREGFHFVGTNVNEWLSRFTILSIEDMEENFIKTDEEEEEIKESHLEYEFNIVLEGNSYNWGGNSNTNIDFKFLECEQGNIYAYIRVHFGVDIRSGYTSGILINLETGSKGWAHYSFLDTLNEVSNDGYVTVNNDEYSVQGNIISEYLSIYNHTTHEDYAVCNSVYEWNEEKFNEALKELVLEALEQNNK